MSEERKQESLAPETLDLLFELSRNAPDEQLKAADAVDSKIFQAFAAGSVLIGLAVVHDVNRDDLTLAFISAAVAAFGFLAAFAISALWSKRFRVGMSPNQLWNDFWPDATPLIKHAYVADLAEGYEVNSRHLASKHRALRVVLLSLLVQASAIGGALIISAANPNPSTRTNPPTTTSAPAASGDPARQP